MKRQLNSSLKRQKRLSAAKGAGPLRQCCVCKKVQLKDKLMRLIKPQTGNALYDHSARMNGRGTYICPETGCLDKIIKGKNSQLGFSKESIVEFKEEVKSRIICDIARGMKLCSKMGYMQKTADQPIDSKDYLIAGNYNISKSDKLLEKAQSLGIKIYNLQGNCSDIFVETAIIKGSWPMQKKMQRNLERVQSLSSRGAVL
jgi:uncharacterized protein